MIERWQRPAEIADGVTMAFRLYIVPAVEGLPATAKAHCWTPVPESGFFATFGVFLATSDNQFSAWLARQSATTLVWETGRPGFESVYVVAATQRIVDVFPPFSKTIRPRAPERLQAALAADTPMRGVFPFVDDAGGGFVDAPFTHAPTESS